VTYEITAQHFGFTNWRWFVHATATLACVALVLFIETLIDSSPVTIKELIPILLTWLIIELWLHFQYNYVLEVDEDSLREGRRVARKGHIRYVREFDQHLWGIRGGARIVVSEYGPWRVRLLGGGIRIPKGLPDYERIRTQVLAWATKSGSD
jgi:hypothetical protein